LLHNKCVSQLKGFETHLLNNSMDVSCAVRQQYANLQAQFAQTPASPL
jgi:hypothetical protein